MWYLPSNCSESIRNERSPPNCFENFLCIMFCQRVSKTFISYRILAVGDGEFCVLMPKKKKKPFEHQKIF